MFKDRPVPSALLVLVVIVVVGTVLGAARGMLEAESIARKIAAENPQDPRDMLHMIVFTHIALGFIASTLLGFLVASVVYLTKRYELADRSLDKQGIRS